MQHQVAPHFDAVLLLIEVNICYYLRTEVYFLEVTTGRAVVACSQNAREQDKEQR